MTYQYEATNSFIKSSGEIKTLLELANKNDHNRDLFLKLAVVSLVTKFQVFVESILEEFYSQLKGKKSNSLPTYLLMNSLRISLSKDNPLLGLIKHKNFTEEKKEKIINYLRSISYFSDPTQEIDENFYCCKKFPLGKTGMDELSELLKIDGKDDPFNKFGEEKINTLNSLLQTRHSIVHQDRFNGTEKTLQDYIIFVTDLVEYIDSYLNNKIININNKNKLKT